MNVNLERLVPGAVTSVRDKHLGITILNFFFVKKYFLKQTNKQTRTYIKILRHGSLNRNVFLICMYDFKFVTYIMREISTFENIKVKKIISYSLV